MARVTRDESPLGEPKGFPSSEDQDLTPPSSTEHTPEPEVKYESEIRPKNEAKSTSKVAHNIHFSFGPHRSFFLSLRNRWWL
jgi:hypothetical protein